MEILWFLGGVFVGGAVLAIYVESKVTPLLQKLAEIVEEKNEA